MHADARNRLQQCLQDRGIDAYVACTPSNLFYLTGFRSAMLEMSWRMTGTDIALLPADEDRLPTLIVSDFVATAAASSSDIQDIRPYVMWVECRDIDVIEGTGVGANAPPRRTRPAQFDPTEVHGLLKSALSEHGLSNGVIGADLRSMQTETLDWMKNTNPGCTFVDCTDLMFELRRIKYPQEVRAHAQAARLFEAGVNEALARMRAGQTANQVRCHYELGVLNALSADPSMGEYGGCWAFISVGDAQSEKIASGNLVKFDCGVIIDGCYSDCAGTFSFERVESRKHGIYDVLSSAHAVALDMLKPGTSLSDIHTATTTAIRSKGLVNYTRGHFGHSIGMDDLIEEPPYISSDEVLELQAGMVLCVEVPYYSDSLGAFHG